MYEIPISIKIEDRDYHIRNNGDYRVILDCFRALEDVELDARERLLAALIIFYEDFTCPEDVFESDDLEELVSEMYNFFNCNQETSGTKTNHKLIDWEKDSQLICSAVNKVANTEIRAVPYIHWWTFMGYYTAIGESLLSTVIRIRDKITKGKPLEKYERAYRAENPQYFVWNSRTVEETEADNLVKQLWNNGD